MEYIITVLATALSVAALFIITRLIGYRQMSEMCLFDYVNGITIGSIGAELATASAGEMLHPLIALILFGLAAVGLSWITNKSRKIRKVLNGAPMVLLSGGKMYRENFSKSRVDIDEFLMDCREAGYFDLNQVECAILEVNGNISILPKSGDRPLTPNDMNIAPASAEVAVSVILDGQLDEKALKNAGYERVWLDRRLKSLGFASPSEVFYAMILSGQLTAYARDNK